MASIVDYLKSINLDSSFLNRAKLAKLYGNQGSPEFQTAFGNDRKQGLPEFTFGGKRYHTGLGNGDTQEVEVKAGRGMTEYLPISTNVLNYEHLAIPEYGAGYNGGVGLRYLYPMHKLRGKLNYFNLFQ